jgi:2-desacetyl-2-hydroxyethyl bacteriochlorophyllide A dehydrogenase
MKAFVLRYYNRDLVLEEVEDPRPGPNDVVLQVKACGICSTDIKLVTGQIPSSIVPLPVRPGHEISGEIVSVGSQVRHLSVGQRGIAYHYVTCRDCEMCRAGLENNCLSVKRLGFELPGGMAELIRLPAYNLCPFDLHRAHREMAILPDAIGTPYHALKDLAQVRAGESVLVVGIGGLGIHAVQIAALMGARVIAADRKSEALELAARFGADAVIESSSGNLLDHVMKITKGKGVDKVIEIVGTPQTLEGSLRCLKPRGTLVMVGYDTSHPFPLPTMEMHYKEWKVFGSRAVTKQELLEVIDLVERDKIKPVVSQVVNWRKANEALKVIQEGKAIGRTVLKFD